MRSTTISPKSFKYRMNGPQSEVSTNVYTCVLIQCEPDTITQLSIVREILSKSNVNVEQTFKN